MKLHHQFNNTEYAMFSDSQSKWYLFRRKDDDFYGTLIASFNIKQLK